MIDTRSLLFYFIVIDFSLLPMLHIAGIPYKPGLLVVGAFFLFTWYRKSTLNLLGLFLGVLFFCLLGAIYQHAYFETRSFSFTLYAMMSYSLGIIGYFYGYYYSPRNINKIITILILLLLMNMGVGLLWEQFPSIINFYKLNSAVREGWIAERNPGLMGNPNGSALVINIILLFIILAHTERMLTVRHLSKIYFVIVFSFIVLLTLSSKNQLMFFFILLLFFLKKTDMFEKFKINSEKIKISLFVVVIFFVSSQISMKYSESSFRNGFYIVTNFFYEINDQYIAPDIDMDNLGDRRVKYIYALKAFAHSPLWGSGFDRAEQGIFSVPNKIGYHSDWSYLLVAGGIGAFTFFLLILYKVWCTHPMLLLPFFLPGLTNLFMLTAQVFCLYGIFWGVLERHRRMKSCRLLPGESIKTCSFSE